MFKYSQTFMKQTNRIQKILFRKKIENTDIYPTYCKFL